MKFFGEEPTWREVAMKWEKAAIAWRDSSEMHKERWEREITFRKAEKDALACVVDAMVNTTEWSTELIEKIQGILEDKGYLTINKEGFFAHTGKLEE